MALKDLDNLAKNAQKFKVLFQAMEADHLSREDFTNAFKSLLAEIKRNVDQLKLEAEQNKRNNESTVEEFSRQLSAQMSELRRFVESKTNETKDSSKSDARTTMRMFEERVQEMISSIPEAYNDAELRESLEEIKESIPEEYDPTEIMEEHEAMKADIEELKQRPVGGGGVRRVFQPYLDRFQGDGATKVFALSREPLRTNNIEVWCTDFPIVLDPNADFTVTGKTLTLTAEVDAPTSGAIIVIKYYA